MENEQVHLRSSSEGERTVTMLRAGIWFCKVQTSEEARTNWEIT